MLNPEILIWVVTQHTQWGEEEVRYNYMIQMKTNTTHYFDELCHEWRQYWCVILTHTV